MKKRKRKLTEKERKDATRRVLQRSAKDILYMGKIVPDADNPRAVARYLAQELFECPPRGAWSLGRIVERRWNEKQFVAKMLIALGEYLKEGEPMFDDVDVDAANIKRLKPHIRFSKIVDKLEERHPNFTRDALERRVSRLLEHIPREYLELPPL
jgi:hypothetical protein